MSEFFDDQPLDDDNIHDDNVDDDDNIDVINPSWLDDPVEDEDGESRNKLPTDLAVVPDGLAAYPHDAVQQSSILREIVEAPLSNDILEDRFNEMYPKRLKLSKLEASYLRGDKTCINRLSVRNRIEIDDRYIIPHGKGRISVKTSDSKIDYHLTVANCIGFGSLLPNSNSNHQFSFELDLLKPHRSFKGKHAMLGFDPTGSMLYIGRAYDEDVFLAMAPNGFVYRRAGWSPGPRTPSSSSPLMRRRHYRQVVMMLAHFLSKITDLAFYTSEPVYKQDLDSEKPKFENISLALCVFSLSSFHIVRSYRPESAPPSFPILCLPGRRAVPFGHARPSPMRAHRFCSF